MMNGMMVVCGNSMEDLRNGVEAMEQALRSGAVMGVGGSSLADIKSGMAMMENAMGGCSCNCGCSCCEDEEDEHDEILGAVAEMLADYGMGDDSIEEVLDIVCEHLFQ